MRVIMESWRIEMLLQNGRYCKQSYTTFTNNPHLLLSFKRFKIKQWKILHEVTKKLTLQTVYRQKEVGDEWFSLKSLRLATPSLQLSTSNLTSGALFCVSTSETGFLRMITALWHRRILNKIRVLIRQCWFFKKIV